MHVHQRQLPRQSEGAGDGTTAVPAATPQTGSEGGSGRVGAGWRRRLVRLLAVVAVVLVLAVIGLRGRLPAPGDVLDSLRNADYGWITIAALLQVASIGAFALQQRRLLRSFGQQLRRGYTFAVILASTALSISMPAGPAVATAYTVQKYQRAGATREIAAASVIVSGLASIGGLALLYVGGGLVVAARSPTMFLNWRPLAIVVGLAAITTAAVLLGRRHTVRRSPDGSAKLGGTAGRLTGHLRALRRSARDAWRAGADLRARDWGAALAYATVKWLGDLLCLMAVAQALDLPVSMTTLAGIYLSYQIVRQVPLTPGGIGVVETALVAGLTNAGAGAASAAAVVVIYRLVSCWLLVPVGGVAALTIRRAPDAAA